MKEANIPDVMWNPVAYKVQIPTHLFCVIEQISVAVKVPGLAGDRNHNQPPPPPLVENPFP